MKVPFVDLKTQYMSLKSQFDKAIENVINEAAFIKGKYVHAFEEEFKSAYGVNHFISCANGTDAIYIALKSLGIGPGDEVVTVANTWISTSEAISQTGALPVFVDIHPDYYTIDVDLIENAITSKTKAILPVHLFGHPCNMDAITSICSKHNLFLVEDCAQAHFAEWKGQKVGTFGDIGTFSFFPGKNLGAYGDAGGIVTNNHHYAEKMRMFANHGALRKNHHEMEGINSRLDGLQGAILSVKLQHIHEWNMKRSENAKIYDSFLRNYDNLQRPKIHPDVKHVFHLYVIRTDIREIVQKEMQEHGIESGIHYPTPLPFLKPYDHLGYKPQDFPVAYEYQDKILSLPMFPELTTKQIEYIAKVIGRSK
jgi:dTDP-4-amino-4,6-dideoxygalactose transaminase